MTFRWLEISLAGLRLDDSRNEGEGGHMSEELALDTGCDADVAPGRVVVGFRGLAPRPAAPRSEGVKE